MQLLEVPAEEPTIAGEQGIGLQLGVGPDGIARHYFIDSMGWGRGIRGPRIAAGPPAALPLNELRLSSTLFDNEGSG